MEFYVWVVEDDISINDIISSALKAEGYKVRSIFTYDEGKKAIECSKPDLIILDINLKGGSGFDLCKIVNSRYSIPIIMVTARNDVMDKILGLELGADDYITKPFHIKEVLTRVKVALRRVEKYKSINENVPISINKSIKIDMNSRTVIKDDDIVKLKPKEYDLLEFLVKHRNKVFSREQLLNQVWDMDYEGDLRTVDVHIRKLRSKLDGEENSCIETVFSVGYVLR